MTTSPSLQDAPEVVGQKLRPEYQKELADLKIKMLDAQAFAEKFPAFSEKILNNKYTSGWTGNMGESYKGLSLGWGLYRHHYTDRKNIMNYKGDFEPQFLWSIYINQVSLFDEYADTGLYDVNKSVDLFFFDALNTTFYATDEQLIPLLDALAEWYKKAKIVNDEWRKEQKKQRLLKELEKLK